MLRAVTINIQILYFLMEKSDKNRVQLSFGKGCDSNSPASKISFTVECKTQDNYDIKNRLLDGKKVCIDITKIAFLY